MFKKKAIQVSVIDKPKKGDDTTPGETKILDPETVKLITEQGKKAVKYLALTVIGVYAAVKLVDTLSEIAVKKTESADND